MSKHTDLIDAVNDAKEGNEKEIAEAILEGFRMGIKDCGFEWSAIEMDIHTMNRIGDTNREMCGGVLFKDNK